MMTTYQYETHLVWLFRFVNNQTKKFSFIMILADSFSRAENNAKLKCPVNHYIESVDEIPLREGKEFFRRSLINAIKG